MDVVNPGFHLDDLYAHLGRRLADNRLEPLFDFIDQHLAPILRAEDDGILAVENDVVVRPATQAVQAVYYK